MSNPPNFFLVGAPKAGTTSLYHYLDQHPQVYMSPIKEPNFFAAEVRMENFDPEQRRRAARQNMGLRDFLSGPMPRKRFGGIVTDWMDYLRLFANAGDASARGEASVLYLWSPLAPARIAERIPEARILVLLRDPADRAFSQYLHGLGEGAIRWSFREHIRRNVHDHSGRLSVHYPFLELGLYSEQLRRYLEAFGSRVWVGFYEDFSDRPMEVYRSICGFLYVARDFLPDVRRRYLESRVPRLRVVGWLRRRGLWGTAARMAPPRLRPSIRRMLIRERRTVVIDPADRRYLLDYYRRDILRLEELVGRKLDAWLR